MICHTYHVHHNSFAPRTDQIDHDLDEDLLDPNLPLRDVVQDLYRTDPIQKACATVDHTDLYDSHPAT